jgi:crossover junction endodeoxyribonuclease RuvC
MKRAELGDMIVGIDPATACGWALLTDGGARVASGVWDLKSRRHEGGGMRFLRARRMLIELLDGREIRAVGYEEVRRHVGTSAAHVYGGLVAVITSVCEERGIPYQGQPVGTVKKMATGKGNASKADMVRAAAARFGGYDSGDDNEADALFIAEAMRREVT